MGHPRSNGHTADVLRTETDPVTATEERGEAVGMALPT